MTDAFRSRYTVQEVAAEFNKILDRDGVLDPERMHDEFAVKSHPLHSRYEWDNRVAARQFRIGQIQNDIRLVRVEFVSDATDEVRSVRAYSSLKRGGVPDGSGYVETAEMVRDPVATELMLRRLQRQIASLKTQYGHLAEFAAIVRRELLDQEGGAA